VNADINSTGSGQEPVQQRFLRFAFTLFAVFVGSLTIGNFFVLLLSASACLWNFHVRCFSISRDVFGIILSGVQLWLLPSFVLALLVAFFLQIADGLVWWKALIAISVSILITGILPVSWAAFAREIMSDPGLFLIAVLMMLIGLQLSRLISRWIGKFPI
jgi:hypothetical protein